MWTVATAIAFASAIHVVTGLPVWVAVIFTALLLLTYLAAGGMKSVAFAQSANCAAFAVMLGIGIFAVLLNPGISGLTEAVRERPEILDPTGVGTGLIVAWFGTFVVNVLLAQAAFQMSLACRTPEDGRKGLIGAAWLAVPFAVVGAVVGIAASIVVPGNERGLVGVAEYIAGVVPAPVAALFFLGVWACALGWGGPCQFSGATSLGRDVGLAIRPNATPADLVRWTRRSLVLLTALMIGFAFLRTSESAWWNVLAWTLRNGATLAPVVGVLFWPLATRRAAIASMGAGFFSGLAWYHLGGWDPAAFFLGIHPVWIGMGVNLATLVVVTLAENSSSAEINPDPRRRRQALVLLLTGAAGGVATALTWDALHPLGLTGLVAFTSLTVFVAGTVLAIRPTSESGTGVEETAGTTAGTAADSVAGTPLDSPSVEHGQAPDPVGVSAGTGGSAPASSAEHLAGNPA